MNNQTIQAKLAKLREDYKKYPDKRFAITLQANCLKSALKAPEKTTASYTPSPRPDNETLESKVVKALV